MTDKIKWKGDNPTEEDFEKAYGVPFDVLITFKERVEKENAKAIFKRLDEIRNREITSSEEQDQQEIDYQNVKKKYCDEK